MCLADSTNDARLVWYFAESYWFRGIGSLSEAVFSQWTNGDDSHSAPHPEPRVCESQTTQKSGLDDDYDMVTGASEEISYCSRWKPSGKQRKTCSSSQSPFRSTNTPAATEAEQISLASQQLGNNSNSRTLVTISIEVPIWWSLQPQQCPGLKRNSRNLRYLKTFSKQASKFRTIWLKKAESTTSILWWGKMRCKQSKSLATQSERI